MTTGVPAPAQDAAAPTTDTDRTQSTLPDRPPTNASPESTPITDLLLPGTRAAMEIGLRIERGPTSDIKWRPAYRDATEAYHDQVRLLDDGTLDGYVAGMPFPAVDPNDPQAGLKIIWNQIFNPWVVDDARARAVEWASGDIVAGRGLVPDTGADLQQHQESMLLRFVGRFRIDPRPRFTQNRERVLQMEALGPTFPALQKLERNGPLVTYRYQTSREDDVWYYTPITRRLRRMSPAVRYNTPGEVVIDLNSIFGFDAPVTSYSWRLLGERKLLGAMNVKNYPATWCPGDGSFGPCDVWEERDAYILEGTALLPYDAYSKRIIAIDKQTWLVLAADLYDGGGQLWKTIFNFWTRTKLPNGADELEPLMLILAGSAIDLQNKRALRWRFPDFGPKRPVVRVNTGLAPVDFSVGRMSSAFR